MRWPWSKIDPTDRSAILDKREMTLNMLREALEEREAVLQKLQNDIEAQKESLVGQEGIEIKRKILLPIMKQKWEAEARRLDAERELILMDVPGIKISLETKRIELQMQINDIKKKPSTMFNSTLLTQCESRLFQLEEIISLIDRERQNEKSNSLPPPGLTGLR